MKITTEFTKLEKSAVKLTVTVSKKDVQEAYNATIAKYVKHAQIPGFRKGHVPQNILERKFGDSLKADSMSELIDKSMNEIFEKESENLLSRMRSLRWIPCPNSIHKKIFPIP